MKKYISRIGVYDANTNILLDTYTFTDVARCQQINNTHAMSYAKNEYRNKRIKELVNIYGDVIYKIVKDELIDPLEKYTFEVI